MTLIHEDERDLVSAVSALIDCNPFLPERLELERRVLGDAFTPVASMVTLHTAAPRRFPAGWQLDVQGRTALESPLPASSAARLALSGSAEQFSFAVPRALTTVAVRRRP